MITVADQLSRCEAARSQRSFGFDVPYLSLVVSMHLQKRHLLLPWVFVPKDTAAYPGSMCSVRSCLELSSTEGRLVLDLRVEIVGGGNASRPCPKPRGAVEKGEKRHTVWALGVAKFVQSPAVDRRPCPPLVCWDLESQVLTSRGP